MYNFFAYLFRMKHIVRWGLMRNTEKENIKEHSFDAAMIAHALAIIGNTYYEKQHDAEHIMALAVFHEAGEVMTGDIATPIKYFNPEIKEAFKAVEDLAEDKIIGMLPEEMQQTYAPLIKHGNAEEYKLVKAADKICAYIKCLEEEKSSNGEFAKAKINIEKELYASELPEVKHFLKHFIEGFKLTLDELN